MARQKGSQVLVPVEQAPGKGGGALVVVEEVRGEVAVLASPVDVAPPGHALRFQWAAAAGASRAEVTSASLQVRPALVRESLGQLPISPSTSHVDITVPGSKRITSLQLEGLRKKNDDGSWTDVRNSSDLADGGPRLVISVQDPAADWLPLYTVPQVRKRGVLPAMFTGASFANRVLTLPAEVAAPKLRLSVVKNSLPEDFQAVDLEVNRVVGWAEVPPRDLALLGPGDAAAWAYPGELFPGSPPVDVDFRIPLQVALEAALAQGGPLDVTFTLRGASPGRAYVTGGNARGALVRAFPGVWQSRLQGDPLPLDLGPGLQGTGLAAERAASVTADLTVRYEGIRILETVSASVPRAAGGVEGHVLTTEPRIVELPPAALGTLPVVRVGLIGRAPEDCELSVALVDLAGGPPGTPLGPPGVIQAGATATVGTVWIDLPPFASPTGPFGLSAHTNRGRFFWVVAGGRPAIRVAVRDPDPGGRPLRLGGQLLAAVHGDLHHPGFGLPPAAFASAPPSLESDLFLTVDLSDLELRYGR
jgi:hypothetical protein